MVRAIMNPTLSLCRACDCVIPSDVEYCFDCTQEINDWHDANKPTSEELEAWSDLWKSKNLVDADRPF